MSERRRRKGTMEIIPIKGVGVGGGQKGRKGGSDTRKLPFETEAGMAGAAHLTIEGSARGKRKMRADSLLNIEGGIRRLNFENAERYKKKK